MLSFFGENAWLVLDGAVILIFAVCIGFAYKRGFMKSAYTVISLALTIVLLYVFQAPFANYISQSKLGENIRQTMTRQVAENMENENSDTDTTLGLPEFVQVKIQGQIDAAEQFTEDLVTDVGNTAADFVIQMLAILILFLLVRIGIFILLKLLDVVFKLPVLKFVNKTAGILIGVVNALLVVYLVAAALTFLVPAESRTAFHQAMNQTFIAKTFYHNNILMEFFM